MPIKLSELAQKLNCRHTGGDYLIENVAEINHATSGDLVFVSSHHYIEALSTTNASAVITKSEWLGDREFPALLTDNPRLVFAKAATLLNPVAPITQCIHQSSIISSNSNVDNTAMIEAYVVIKQGAKIGRNTRIGAGSVIGENVSVGDDTIINSNVAIYDNCIVGSNTIIHSGVIIGADGFGFVRDKDCYFKVPQLGAVRIGDNVEIGAGTTIDKGALRDTVINNNVKLDNQIQIGHNVEIGEHTVISACSCVGGSAIIGKYCLIGGSAGVRDNIEITDNVIITARTFVTESITQSGSYSSATPVDETSKWLRNAIRFKKLDEIFRRVRKLEKKLLKKS